jgi:hypothetical protein
MSERKLEPKVKDVGIDDDFLCIELLNGLRLSGPLRTKPVYRDPVVRTDVPARSNSDFTHSIVTN